MPLTLRHWLLHWVPSYAARVPDDRRRRLTNLSPGPDGEITDIRSECLGAFLRDEAEVYLRDARVAVEVPHVRSALVARYVWAIRRGKD